MHLFLASVVRATLRTRIIILRVLEWWWHDRQNSRAPGCRQACVFGRCFRGPVHYGAQACRDEGRILPPFLASVVLATLRTRISVCAFLNGGGMRGDVHLADVETRRGRRSASRRCRRSFRFRRRIHRRSILDFARSRRAFSLPTPRKVCKSRNAIIARDQESMALQFGEQSCLHRLVTGAMPTDTFVRSCNTITKNKWRATGVN